LIEAALGKIVQMMPGPHPRTAQDLARGKRGEIDHLNSLIARRGEAQTTRDCRYTLKSLLGPQSRAFCGYLIGARGFGGRHAPTKSPRQLKEVIQVTHIEVGSVASWGALVSGEFHR
jgi:hypothetical protein